MSLLAYPLTRCVVLCCAALCSCDVVCTDADPLGVRTGRPQLRKVLHGDRVANYYFKLPPPDMQYKYITRKAVEPLLKKTRVKNRKIDDAIMEQEAAAAKAKAKKK
jgi:hypothetical protein